MGVLRRLAASARAGTIGRISPRGQALIGPGAPLGALFRLMFRPQVSGWDRLPSEGAYLVVVNHSGGGGADVVVLATLWAEICEERHLAGMAHPLLFHFPGLAGLVRDLGAIPSSYARALEALQSGIPVLVFPGGDHEAFRPFWQANKVDFNRREGFLRLAREAGVPIVPLGLRGSAYTNPILWRSKLLPYLLGLPRLVGLKRFPLSLSGVICFAGVLGLGGLAWGYPLASLAAWASLLSPTHLLLPWVPWKVTGSVGEPIPHERLFGAEGLRPLQEAHEEVRAAVEALVRADPREAS